MLKHAQGSEGDGVYSGQSMLSKNRGTLLHYTKPFLQSEAAVLRAKMEAVRAEIDKVNRETGSSMEDLVQMDLLKGIHLH